MSGTAQIIIAALGLAGELAPYAIEGVKALVAAIEAHTANGTKMSLDEIEDMAAEHGVDLPHLASRLDEAR